MAEMTVELRIRKAWWVWPAIWLIFPVHLVNPLAAERFCLWIIDKGVTPHVS